MELLELRCCLNYSESIKFDSSLDEYLLVQNVIIYTKFSQ